MTVEKKTGGIRVKLALLNTIMTRSLTAVGLLTVTTFALLSFDSNFATKAANALSSWVSHQENSNVEVLELAPFKFDEVFAIDENTLPEAGDTNHAQITTIASLPILELEALTPEQLKVTRMLANRYRVAPQVVALIVQEAWNIGEQKNIDPTLILAIASVESRFNPYAQSEAGATGLMQIMTRIHADKLERTGGAVTVFDPVTNMRVGVQILEEHIKRAGSLEGGLKQYVGAVGSHDYGYGKKVFTERDRIRRAAFGSTEISLQAILEVGKQVQSNQEAA